MAKLPIDEAVDRFKDNEDRFDKFVNDDVGYNSSTGEAVESVQAFLGRVETEIEETTGTVAENLAASETLKLETEAARDAALIQAGVYVDISTGLAAVADGEAFKVQGSGNVAAYEYRRIDAATATLIATYPSKSAYDSVNKLAENTDYRTIALKRAPKTENGDLFYITVGGTVLLKFDKDGKLLSDHSHSDLEAAIQALQLSQPSNLPIDSNKAIWGVKAGDVLLGFFDNKGVWHSDHKHDEYGKEIPLEANNLVWGVSVGGKLLGFFDKAGIWHSDHEHTELENSVATLESEVASLKESKGGNVKGWIAREVTVSTEQQIFVHDENEYRQLTQAGFNWVAPIVHSDTTVRCLSDYTSNDGLQPHTILENGEIIPEAAILVQQLVTGQSLSLGSRGYVLDPDGDYVFQAPDGIGNLFTEQCPEDLQEYCLTLNGGARASGTTLVPTQEYPDGVLGETVCSSYMIARARYVEKATNGLLPRLAAIVSGTGGVPYDNLKKGTAVYTTALNRTSAVRAAAIANGWKHVVSTIRIIHGESQSAATDPIDKTEAGYAAVLREWVSDYQADILAITGQNANPVGMVCQMNTQGVGNVEIPLAQLKAHEDNSDIILIGPKYQHPYWDSAHMLAEGYVKTGELEARALRFVNRGQKWECLRPLSVVLVGTTVTIEFNNTVAGDENTPGPIGELVLDQASISNPGNYGFACTDGDVNIVSVVVGSNKTSIEITFDVAPTLGEFITYALQVGISQPTNGPRGNLRDSDNRDLSRFDNASVYNWSVAFKKAITS